MKKQIIVYADMEGASGIFDHNGNAVVHGSPLWREYGKKCITSDVRAVCQAAHECEFDEIAIYDGHFAGNPEYNIIVEELPGNIKLFDTTNRCFDWRRIRGQADLEPFGLITVGQHARYGEPNAYFPHTIQSPPIKSLYINDKNIAEIGMCAYNFLGIKYIANIGCAASMTEAKEISHKVTCISVKDKKNKWEPNYFETFSVIKENVIKAIRDIDNKEIIEINAPFIFKMEVCDNFIFKRPDEISWKGTFSEKEAYWEAPSVEIGFELFNCVRSCIIKILKMSCVLEEYIMELLNVATVMEKKLCFYISYTGHTPSRDRSRKRATFSAFHISRIKSAEHISMPSSQPAAPSQNEQG
jgi:D-aminopeptidase